MKTDRHLDILCEEIADLEEGEKDYLLDLCETLAFSVFGKNHEYFNINFTPNTLKGVKT